jgi:hypothetical protein
LSFRDGSNTRSTGRFKAHHDAQTSSAPLNSATSISLSIAACHSGVNS